MAVTLIEYEKLVLSVILVNALPSSILPRQICAELTPDKFSIKEHKILFRAIREIVQRNELPNIPTISLFLKPEELTEIGGEPYLRSLQSFLGLMGVEEVGEEHKSWVALIDVAGRCRVLGTVVRQYATKLDDLEKLLPTLTREGQFEEFLENFLNDVQASGTFGLKGKYVHISSLFDEEMARLQDELDGHPRDTIYVGWPKLLEYGIPRKGVLNVLAGLTGSGKTTLASLILVGAALNLYLSGATAHVAYNCMEDSKEELYRRMGCALAMVDSQKFKNGVASIEEMERYRNALSGLNKLPIFIDDRAGITSNELRLEADLLRMQQGAGDRVLGVSDYSELFGDKGRDENDRLSKMARTLHIYARDRGSAELLLTQYPELYTPDQIGGMKSKQARAIGQAAKVYMEIWNLPELLANSYANPNFDSGGNNLPNWADSRFAYILLHKNSGGKKGRLPLTWADIHTRFRDPTVKDSNELYQF